MFLNELSHTGISSCVLGASTNVQFHMHTTPRPGTTNCAIIYCLFAHNIMLSVQCNEVVFLSATIPNTRTVLDNLDLKHDLLDYTTL